MGGVVGIRVGSKGSGYACISLAHKYFVETYDTLKWGGGEGWWRVRGGGEVGVGQVVGIRVMANKFRVCLHLSRGQIFRGDT